MIATTLNRIRDLSPFSFELGRLFIGLGKTKADDEPLPYARIVEIVGLDYALWCCQAESKYKKEWLLFGAWCARQVQHLMTDQCSIAALDVTERYANGRASADELEAACKAASSAATEKRAYAAAFQGNAWNSAQADSWAFAYAAWAASHATWNVRKAACASQDATMGGARIYAG